MLSKKHSIYWLYILGAFLSISMAGNVVLFYKLQSGSVVTTVFDGDSFELADGRRVRLLGVDAPETGRCMADDAKDALTKEVLGKHVSLHSSLVDDYGRVVADVLVHSKLVSVGLVELGLAKYLATASPYKVQLEEASNQARASKRGIYSDTCRGEDHPAGCDIKENIRKGVKVFYTTDCPYYKEVIVDTSFGDRWFCSDAEAKSEGFIPAPSCGRK